MDSADNSGGRTVHISTTSVFKALLAILLVLFLYVIRDVLVMVVFAVVIASAINPVVKWMQNRGLPRTLSVFLVFIALFLILAGVLFLIIRPVAGELADLSRTLPVYFERISLTVEEVRDASPAYQEILNNVQTYLNNFATTLSSVASNTFAALAKLFGGITTAVVG